MVQEKENKVIKLQTLNELNPILNEISDVLSRFCANMSEIVEILNSSSTDHKVKNISLEVRTIFQTTYYEMKGQNLSIDELNNMLYIYNIFKENNSLVAFFKNLSSDTIVIKEKLEELKNLLITNIDVAKFITAFTYLIILYEQHFQNITGKLLESFNSHQAENQDNPNKKYINSTEITKNLSILDNKLIEPIQTLPRIPLALKEIRKKFLNDPYLQQSEELEVLNFIINLFEEVTSQYGMKKNQKQTKKDFLKDMSKQFSKQLLNNIKKLKNQVDEEQTVEEKLTQTIATVEREKILIRQQQELSTEKAKLQQKIKEFNEEKNELLAKLESREKELLQKEVNSFIQQEQLSGEKNKFEQEKQKLLTEIELKEQQLIKQQQSLDKASKSLVDKEKNLEQQKQQLNQKNKQLNIRENEQISKEESLDKQQQELNAKSSLIDEKQQQQLKKQQQLNDRQQEINTESSNIATREQQAVREFRNIDEQKQLLLQREQQCQMTTEQLAVKQQQLAQQEQRLIKTTLSNFNDSNLEKAKIIFGFNNNNTRSIGTSKAKEKEKDESDQDDDSSQLLLEIIKDGTAIRISNITSEKLQIAKNRYNSFQQKDRKLHLVGKEQLNFDSKNILCFDQENQTLILNKEIFENLYKFSVIDQANKKFLEEMAIQKNSMSNKLKNRAQDKNKNLMTTLLNMSINDTEKLQDLKIYEKSIYNLPGAWEAYGSVIGAFLGAILGALGGAATAMFVTEICTGGLSTPIAPIAGFAGGIGGYVLGKAAGVATGTAVGFAAKKTYQRFFSEKPNATVDNFISITKRQMGAPIVSN